MCINIVSFDIKSNVRIINDGTVFLRMYMNLTYLEITNDECFV